MNKELQLRIQDNDLTLSDGTPLRLALPGPPPRASRAPWFFIALTLTLAAYLGWWAQQPWLFIKGPTLISTSTPSGMSAVICDRLTGNLERTDDARDLWLPLPTGAGFQARCLDASPRLETLMATALLFIGAPVPVLALDAVATDSGWDLRAQLNGQQRARQSDLGHELALLPDLRRLALDSVNPVFAAQSHLARGEADAALAVLGQATSPEADLTRARALYLLGRNAEAWHLYEAHEYGPHQGLVRMALAQIAADDGNTDSAMTMLVNAGSAAPELRVALALRLGQTQLAEQWIDSVDGAAQWPLRAQLADSAGRPEQVVAALQKLAPAQLSTDQRIALARALRAVGRIQQAMDAIAEVTAPAAGLIRAQLRFDGGEVDQALADASVIGTPEARLWAATQWAWDDDAERALALVDDRTDAGRLVAIDALLPHDAEGAQTHAVALTDAGLAAWAQGRIALQRGDTAAATQWHRQLANHSPDHANHLGTLINLAHGFTEEARASLAKLPSTPAWNRHRFMINLALGVASRSQLSPGEQRLTRLVRAQFDQAMDDNDPALAAQIARTQLQARVQAGPVSLWLARAYQAQGLDQAALDSYAHAHAGRGLDLPDANAAAALASKLGAYDQVSQWLSPFADVLDTPGQSRLVQAWINTGQTEAAETWIRQAVVRAPNDPTLYVLWGQVAEGSGDLIGAVSKYRQSARLNPRYAPAHLAWALALEQRGERNAAIKRMAQAKANLNDEQWHAMASFYTRMEYPDLAAQALNNVDAPATDLRLKVASLQAAQGFNHAAHESFSLAMTDDVSDPGLWRTWGDSLAALGQTTEALDKYKVAVRLSR